MNDLNPPAIIRPAKRCREELEIKAKSAFHTYSHHGRKFVETGCELGEILTELRDDCTAAGEWYPLLQKLGIPQSTARRVIAKFKGQAKERTAHVSGTLPDVEEEVAAHMEEPPAEQQVIAGALDGPWPENNRCRDCRTRGLNIAKCKKCQEQNKAPIETPPPKAAKLCTACNASGYKIGCEDCKRLNGGKKADVTKPAPPKPDPSKPREPGSDDGDVDAAYAKYEEARLKAVTGVLVREMRKIGGTYGLKVPPPNVRFQPSLPFKEWFGEFDPRFQRVLKKPWDARAELRVLLAELEQEKTKGDPQTTGGLPE